MLNHKEMTLGDLLETYYWQSNDYRDRGDKFERLIRSYLLTDPEWSSQFSDVWLWKDYPQRGNRQDTGVDIVAQDRFTAELVAVQCKFVDPGHTISKREIDSFISASPAPEFSRRILAHTANIGPTAQKTLEAQDPPVQTLDPFQMQRSEIQWADFEITSPERLTHKSGRKTPFPYQQEAINDVLEGFKSSDRGKLVMACGTGKTFTSLQIMEQAAPPEGTVLFLVPSIALLDQTLREWKKDAHEDFQALAVCSDSRVGKNTQNEDISTTDLIIPATTNAERLLQRQKLAAGYRGRTVIFSTYQSIEVLHEAQLNGLKAFDLIICDEAHRTTGATLHGQKSSVFTRIHDNEYIRGSRRLYMTATPRVFDENTKRKADEQSIVVISMDNEKFYGPTFHRLGFGQAVSQGLLTDYKVLILAVDESSINSHFQELLADEHGELAINDAAKIVGCWNALANRGQSDEKHESAVEPMQRAVAFASSIKESERVATMFERVTEQLAVADGNNSLICRAEHVDGSMNVAERTSKLNWLETTPGENEARILTNARCLSEGVDVPSLDSVIFLNPRNSQVDVVQSVGRVMRRAKGKDYGYIILPVAIPVGSSPEQTLKDSKKYKVIWSVLNALRSHDDRFEATVNKIDLNQGRNDQIDVIGVRLETENLDSTETKEKQLAFKIDFPGLDDWKKAIYARIVEKVGDRKYWEDWASDVAEVAQRHFQRISSLVRETPEPIIASKFQEFVQALKRILNDAITEDDAISMLSQHLITKPVFDALFDDYDFVANNPVSKVMETMVSTLQGKNLEAETASLKGFYDSVAQRAAGIDNAEGRQRIINDLYENFFKKAFPAQADANGVVYTPVPVVDFILNAVNDLSQQHFSVGLSDEGVHVLDPFTGTGTFIVRLLRSGIINSHDLARKYSSELHANEIMLLAYYIAAINIEATYHSVSLENKNASQEYQAFENIVFGDTFQMSEDDTKFEHSMFGTNSVRAKRQLDTNIQIIIGNPPWRASQDDANDMNANVAYPKLDKRIKKTYVEEQKRIPDVTKKNLNSLYDSYIRAFRWGTDRIIDKGILAFVSNGGYIDTNTAAGLRKALADDFDKLYVYNLRGGNPISKGKKEGGNVFDVMVDVAILIGIKDPSHEGPSELYYCDIGDNIPKEQKLEIISRSKVDTLQWQKIEVSPRGEWVNQSSDYFYTLRPLGDKSGDTGQVPIFTTYSRGLETGRDTWVYNFSHQSLSKNLQAMMRTFNEARKAYTEAERTKRNEKDVAAWLRSNPEFTDSTQVAWTRSLRQHAARDKTLVVNSSGFRTAIYRPFMKQHVYFGAGFNHEMGMLPRIFPTPSHHNYGFYVPGIGAQKPFSVLASDSILDLNFWGSEGGQFFPRWSYEALDDNSTLDIFDSEANVIDGYRRIDNITDQTLRQYQKEFGSDVTKDQIFEYIYALLHSEQYRTAFKPHLRRQLPRIPMPQTRTDFLAFAESGNYLLDLHINYETAQPYELLQEHIEGAADSADLYRVSDMRWGGSRNNPDKTILHYNDCIVLSGIPSEAHDYKLGTRSALEWVVDRYTRKKPDSKSNIVNDPNTWLHENNAPKYIIELIKRVITISIETIKVSNRLPKLDLE